MSEHNYYHILGISPLATEEQVRKAYTREIKNIHPDHSGRMDTAVYKRIQTIKEAYETLKREETRSRYDKTLNIMVHNGSLANKRRYKAELEANDNIQRTIPLWRRLYRTMISQDAKG